MSMSPSNILSKLEELRKWQEKQQERLLEQHNKRLEQNSFTATERDFLQNTLGANVSFEKIQNRTASSSKSSKQIKQKEEYNENATVDKTAKPKQPFLRRGAGLSRFRMNPGEQFKPFTKADRDNWSASVRKASTTPMDSAVRKAPTDSKIKISEFSETKKSILTPLKVPDISVKPRATWHTAFQNENQAPINNAVFENRNVELTPIKSKNVNRIERQELTGPNLNSSDRELLLFEALEQRATQNSFCSTNSSIVRLLSSTPHKNVPSKGEKYEAVYAHQQTADENIMQVRYAQYSQNKQTPVITEIVDDVLENDAKTIEDLQGNNNHEKKLQNELMHLIEKAIKFKKFVAGDDLASYTSSSSVTSEDLEHESTLQFKSNFNDDKKWSDVETCESTSSSLNTSKILDHQDHKRDMETMTDDLVDDRLTQGHNQELLSNKFKELEKDLKTIQTENAKIRKLKNELEQQRREFEKHKKEIVKQVEDEKVRVNYTLEEERKKLAKEKLVFERGQLERRLKDSCEVHYPNGIIRRTQSTGTEEICYPDGTTVTVNMQGERFLQLPNGQKEIHTKEHKRREYPDGTVKILYPDGLQETRYANGRVRLKDKHGKLLIDSHNPDMLDL